MPIAATKLDISREQHTEEIPASCYFTPRTVRDLLCYYAFILFVTSFLWFAGLYLWAIHDNKDEERVGMGLTIAGIVVGGGAILVITSICLCNCNKPLPETEDKDDDIEMQEK
ncbi:hypothetical protein PTSG_03523 [Salpingoeca rosetta]|uniref:Uncharacterized protein n=1 Tax=Salpingoeca rosetta (strain ATCC 50818 / BSB-021) TaxID=946362 RepID=F2U5V1_SALR5|nr:uncharacterized protein PTSG_03523 [Salpingoeca rosetta]EGD82892.1 hypothetical protein PTSG_03523 [Salpingoeca rosetta]|eukprot:XP_004995256.1 hypothetical protein PTSG_03523 [Salpingoeca rosetta]